jgi:sugar lactone lactonase YvrE
VYSLLAALLAAACVSGSPASGANGHGFQVPECAVVDPVTGYLYVSNIESKPGEYWAADGQGFISRLKPDGKVDALRWRDSSPKCVLNAPKGMCIVGRTLYVADIDRVVKFSLTSAASGVIKVPGAKRLNDMASDGKAPYVSDTEAGKIYRLDTSGRGAHKLIQSPKSVNGIAFGRGKMFAVSWDLHDIYEVDPSGRRAPKAFGLAKHFTNLDGIEVLADGSFVVSDFYGNQICMVSASRKNVRKVATCESPADIGIDRKGGRLFAPLFLKDQIKVYNIQAEKR